MRALTVAILVVSAFAVSRLAADASVQVDRVRSVRTLQASAARAARLVVFVVDDTGQPFYGARVRVHDARGRVLAEADTSEAGVSRFEFQARGAARVSASFPGMSTAEARGIQAEPGRLAAVALAMELGQLKDPIFTRQK